MNLAAQKRRASDRALRNEEARALLPKPLSPERVKARAEEVMTAHDQVLETRMRAEGRL